MISDSVKRSLSNFLSFNVNVLSSNFNLISTTGHFSRYITEINKGFIIYDPLSLCKNGQSVLSLN